MVGAARSSAHTVAHVCLLVVDQKHIHRLASITLHLLHSHDYLPQATSSKTLKMVLSGKTDNPSFVLRGVHDTVYEDVSLDSCFHPTTTTRLSRLVITLVETHSRARTQGRLDRGQEDRHLYISPASCRFHLLADVTATRCVDRRQ